MPVAAANDAHQSVAVSKRGYGSMAVSNCVGSQIINVCIGLGMPWFIVSALGHPVAVTDPTRLTVAAAFVLGGVALYSLIISGGTNELSERERRTKGTDARRSSIFAHSNKALLTVTKGKALCVAYVIFIVVYGATVLSVSVTPSMAEHIGRLCTPNYTDIFGDL